MSWTDAAKYYGLRAPYNFRVAIPLILGASALLAVLLVCVFMFSTSSLSLGTERFYFFTYIIVLLCAAATLSRVTFLSAGILIWCTLELGLAISSSLLTRSGIGPLFPEDYFTPKGVNSTEHPTMFHLLLQRVPKPNWKGYSLVHALDERNKDKGPLKNWPIKWAAVEGKDFTFSHNSLGFRGAELTEDDFNRDIIFVYGGSSTYDVAVTQGETWVERLQLELNNEFSVLNFGVSTHSTTEHLIQTAFYQNVVPKKPVCALYYVGWNDLWHAHIDNFDAAYVDYHGPLIAIRRPDLYFSRYSPALRLATIGLKARFDTVPQPRVLLENKPISGPDQRLEQVFYEHVSTISAINISRDIRPVFIGQILNREFYKLAPKDRNALAHFVNNEDTWPLQERLNLVLKNAAIASGAKYIDAGIEHFTGDDFVDQGHFVAAGSSKFAKLISKEVGNSCRRIE
jgi:hypothetical protein